MNRIPRRLKKEPIIEVIWQVQFDIPNAVDALPGILYSNLRKQYLALEMRRMPVADIPSVIAQTDPNLRFAAKVQLEDPNTPFIWQVGDRVVTINCRKPYVGWQKYKEAILNLIAIVEGSSLVMSPQRHSLRYIDLLTLHKEPDLSALQLHMQLGTYKVKNIPLQMRMELLNNDFLHVIQIVTPAQVQLLEGRVSGSVVDLETLSINTPENWNQIREQLETMHNLSKHFFFTRLLTPEAIQALEPEY